MCYKIVNSLRCGYLLKITLSKSKMEQSLGAKLEHVEDGLILLFQNTPQLHAYKLITKTGKNYGRA